MNENKIILVNSMDQNKEGKKTNPNQIEYEWEYTYTTNKHTLFRSFSSISSIAKHAEPTCWLLILLFGAGYIYNVCASVNIYHFELTATEINKTLWTASAFNFQQFLQYSMY